ncbi:LacI family DNA-binding transcriptional regulator [Demequina soli]|uniref:LacI family DNA-binding transcriptional regulator n=1 Tax=Demequina soli TaxID=1638987 RepID=UPI003F722DC4
MSFVLNNTPTQSISAATRARVLEAARELNYIPHAAGLALAKGRTDTVVLDLGTTPFSSYQVGEFAEEFSRILEEHGHPVVVHARAQDPQALVRLTRATEPFAVVSLDPRTSAIEAELRAAGATMVEQIDALSAVAASDWAREAALLQLGHLSATGRRAIGFVHPVETAYRSESELKHVAAIEVAQEIGAAVGPAVTLTPDRDQSAAAVRRWLEDSPALDAAIAFNDETALALLAVLSDLGRRVPDDIAVIGTDDVPLARYATPPLTTLRARSREGAAYVAARLLTAMDRPMEAAMPPHIFDLVVRGSA